EPLLAHRLGLRVREDADEAFPAGLGPHLVEVLREPRRDVVEPHDELGNVGVHQFRVPVHILERRVLDVDRDVRTGLQLRPGRFDPTRQLGYPRLRLGNLLLAFQDLGIEIGHGAPRMLSSFTIWGGGDANTAPRPEIVIAKSRTRVTRKWNRPYPLPGRRAQHSLPS